MVALPWSATGNIHALSSDRDTAAQLQPLEKTDSQAHPEDNANRLRIPHPGESNINVLSSLSNPDFLHDLPDYTFGKLSDDSHPTNNAPLYFCITQNMERSLIIKKLIFPFHSFL
jgi:hypothetical protein